MANLPESAPHPAGPAKWLPLLLLALTLTACDARPTTEVAPPITGTPPAPIVTPTNMAEPAIPLPTATAPATVAATATPTATATAAAPQALLFARADDLYLADPDGGRIERLTTGGLLGLGLLPFGSRCR